MGDISKEGPDTLLEMLMAPPPPPRKILPDPGVLGAAPEKPERPPSVALSHFLPPQLDNAGTIRSQATNQDSSVMVFTFLPLACRDSSSASPVLRDWQHRHASV